MATRRFLISGRVQGVFYRGWSVQTARDLGLDGWVRNLRSGEVELVASGPDEALDGLAKCCRQGPAAARVEDVRISVSDEPVEPGFRQLPTL